MDDGIARFIGVFLRLLSNVNDCVVPGINSYSSVDDVVVGVISSFNCGCFVSLGFCWIGIIVDFILLLLFG
jgi:hypothetical protein